MITNFEDLKKAVQRKGKVRMAVCAAADETVISAVKMAVDAQLVDPILVGEEDQIREIAEQVGLTSYCTRPSTDNIAEEAVKLVRRGEADILMKGMINTSDFLRAVLNRDFGLRTERLLSMFAVFEVPGYPKLIYTSDSGVNVAPNLAEKKQILVNMLTAMERMDIHNPNVCVLSSNEQVSDKIPSTVDAKHLVEMVARGELPACIIEGPMAFDVAFDKQAAVHKGIDSKIAGDIDVLLFPNIETGNALAKSWIHFNQAKWAGIVLGASAPIVLGSRSDSPDTKLNAIALACLSV